MILLGSFEGIVGAVRAGRTVFGMHVPSQRSHDPDIDTLIDNLRKTITYLLPAGTFSELCK